MIKLPARISSFTFRNVAKVKVENINPLELKYAIRQACRENCPEYFEAVELDPKLETEVDVSNLGRWVFGVKGFAGHYKQKMIDSNTVEIFVPDIELVIYMIKCGLQILKINGICNLD